MSFLLLESDSRMGSSSDGDVKSPIGRRVSIKARFGSIFHNQSIKKEDM